jgi:hypothetical protein
MDTNIKDFIKIEYSSGYATQIEQATIMRLWLLIFAMSPLNFGSAVHAGQERFSRILP